MAPEFGVLKILGVELIGMEYIYTRTLRTDALCNEALWPFPFFHFVSAAGIIVEANASTFIDGVEKLYLG